MKNRAHVMNSNGRFYPSFDDKRYCHGDTLFYIIKSEDEIAKADKIDTRVVSFDNTSCYDRQLTIVYAK